MKPTISLLFAASLGLAVLCSGCGSAPSDHTVDEGGTMHKPGLKNPTHNCTSCHGANLEGDSGPSCTQCHGKRW